MIRQGTSRRVAALAMAALMGAAAAVPAAAAPIDSGVTPAYDEAYYATLDYYGNLLEGSVVKSYSLNGAGSLTDYGVYDQVVNLTDNTPVAMSGGRAEFQFNQPPEHFYFEGKTAQPFQELPWTVTLRYTLNGVPARAEELAGKTGVVEILLDIVPNPRASSYARYNYTLEAMALFNQDDILSLEAQGAQVQLVGNLRTVLFMCLPGEEQHFTIRVGSNDFSFSGMTILMVPATLAQLEEIAKLSQRKDDLEEDYRALSGSLDALLDAMYEIQDGLYASAQGLDQLNIARGTISQGKGQLYSDAGALRGDLTAIADLLEPVERRALILSQTITSSKVVLGDMVDTAVSLQTQLDNLEDALRGLESGASDARQVIRGLADMKSSLRSLQRALGDSYIGGGSSGDRNTPKLSEQVEKTKQVGSAYQETDRQTFLEKMLTLNGESGAAAKAEAAENMLKAVENGVYTEEQVAALYPKEWAAAKQMNGLNQMKSQMSFQQFCGSLPGVDDKTAKQMSDLWTVYNSGGAARDSAHQETEGQSLPAPEAPPSETRHDSSDSTGSEPEEETVPNSSEPEEETAPDSSEPEEGTAPDSSEPEEGTAPNSSEPEESAVPALGGAVLSASLCPGTEILSAALVGGGLYIDDFTASDAGTNSSGSAPAPSASGENSAPASTGGSDDSSAGSGDETVSSGGEDIPSGDDSTGGEPVSGGGAQADASTGDSSQTVGGAAVDLIVGGLDDAMSQASAKIDAIQSELNSTINRITRPTGRVVGELAGLCDDVDDLVDLIDSAEDLSAALRQSSEKMGDILDGVDALRNILSEYEPTLQESIASVGSLSTSAVSALRDLETLLADSEALMKTSGNQLDAGTRQSLRGLAATLRQTAKAMEATGDVRQAKLTINNIIEDTWHEYTGDINNILLMDAEAEAVSLTDSRNPAPSSVQVLIRTKEIKAEEPEKLEELAAVKAETTFWGRVAQMFKDFWKAITGIFH